MNNRILGSVFLISGTSIGAGMLALPFVSAATGFITSTFLMFVVFSLATYGSVLIAQALQSYPEAQDIHGVVGHFLGKKGQVLTIFAMIFLYGSLCAAYINGISQQIDYFIGFSNFELKPGLSTIATTFFLMMIIFFGSTDFIDLLNRFLFIGMLLTIFIIMFYLLPNMNVEQVSTTKGRSFYWLSVLPLLYVSFGYQNVIPTVLSYLGKRYKFYSLIFVTGGIIAFVVYLLWQSAVMGSVLPEKIFLLSHQSNNISALSDAIIEVTESSKLSIIINVFTVFALLTSMLGVAMGFYHYLIEMLSKLSVLYQKIIAMSIVFLLPMMISLYYPKIFIIALGYASIALVIITVFIPVWITKKLIKGSKTTLRLKLKNNVFILWLALLGGLSLIIIQILISFNVLPSLS